MILERDLKPLLMPTRVSYWSLLAWKTVFGRNRMLDMGSVEPIMEPITTIMTVLYRMIRMQTIIPKSSA
jgi:energy-converting hydrogenase Eha subunit C